jgi:hypothetical protein
MSRKKRSKQRVPVGPKMRAVAGQQPGLPAGRSAGSSFSEKAALFEELAQSLARATASEAEPETKAGDQNESASDNQTAELTSLLAEVATGLWRLRQKMLPDGGGQPSEENRRSYRQLESVLDMLAQGGVKIRDHTGEAVPRGGIYTLKALAYEPTAGLARDQVIETLKPTIAFKDRVIQTGEVVVGTPIVGGD